MTTPLISVIIPFYNRIPYLQEAINSVLKQTYQNYEIILVNDGSTDPIPRELSTHPKIRLIHQVNKGPAAARNRGVKEALGEYIAFLDADDWFTVDKLSSQIDHMLKNNSVISHTSYDLIDKTQGTETLIQSGLFQGRVYPKILLRCPIATPTVCIKKSIIQLPLFNEELKIGEDVVCWNKLSYSHRIDGINKAYTKVRLHGNNAAYGYFRKIPNNYLAMKYTQQEGIKVPLTYWFLRMGISTASTLRGCLNSVISLAKKIPRSTIQSLLLLALPFILLKTYLESLFSTTPKLTILMFHYIPKEHEKKLQAFLHILSKFNSFLEPSQLEDFLAGKIDVPTRSLLITFDDGYKNTYHVTKNILNPLEISSTTFIATGFINSSNDDLPDFVETHFKIPFSSEVVPMSTRDIVDIVASGNAIGAHTVNHKNLSTLDSLAQRDEIINSKKDLEKITSIPTTWFAYPFGGLHAIDQSSLEIIEQNYSLNFTGIRGSIRPKHPPHKLLRQDIDINSSLLQMLLSALGGYDILHTSNRIKLKRLT